MTANAAVTAILPRGEAIKNFVYSGALDELAKTNRVDVWSVVPNPDIAALLARRYGEITPLDAETVPLLVRLEREILDLAHARWLWSEATQNHWLLRDTAARASRGQRLRRELRKAIAAPFANRAGLALLSSLDRRISDRLRSSDRWSAVLRARNPALVFNGSHVHNAVSTPVVRAAQGLGIRTAAFLFSWDNLTSQGRMMPTYDHYLVWNDEIKSDLLRIYPRTAAEDVRVTGTPQFDFHFRPELQLSRAEFCARIGADPDRPIVLYSTSMPYHTPEEPRIVESVAAALQQIGGCPKPQLLVRIYPKDTTGRFAELQAKQLPDVLFPPVPWEPNWLTPTYDDCALLTNTLRHVALGINVASTVSLELCMFDKPVINIGYDPPGIDIRPISYARYYSFDHYRPVVASGAIDVVQHSGDLVAAIQNAFDAPARRAPMRRALLQRMFGETLDGRSATRVARALSELSRRRERERYD